MVNGGNVMILFFKFRNPKIISFLLLLGMAISLFLFNCELKKQKNNSVNLIDRIDVSRGICVVLGDSTGELAIDLAYRSELLVYSQLQNEAHVQSSRKAVDEAGFYGTRIYVEKGELDRVHLSDNLADALIAVGETKQLAKSEALRVLRPQGKAFVGDEVWEKPFPKGVDDWSHPYHGPDNNTQSNDQVARAPYLTQFFADPRYAPAIQVAVASAGRIFKAFGNVAFHEREEPFLFKLAAFNGYNGTMLWKRDLPTGVMVHRNIIIATPDILYVGDDKSCKKFDAETGMLRDEIKPPIDVAGGTFWKWMGMEHGVLFALIGEQEQKDPVMRWRRTKHGWPWTDISKGFNQTEHPWGFGRTLLAINPKSKKVLWSYREDEPADTRALVMKNQRIFLFRFGTYLTCINAKSGKVIWRKTSESDSALFDALGAYLPRQSYETNWRTTNYLMCSEDALYFAGPQVGKLLAVSTKDGSVLWENPFNNFQLVLRDDGLYGISGPWRNNVSKKFDPLTGEILTELPTGRRACTRPSGSADAIFFRASGGTIRFDLESLQPQWISPMRPSCHDGVTIANGFLYWWPYVCDCQLSIYGITCLGPAGDFTFNAEAIETERLEKGKIDASKIEKLLITDADWPMFRKDITGSAASTAIIPNSGKQIWQHPADNIDIPGTDILGHAFYKQYTAPVTSDGFVYYSGSDGVVRALDAKSGELLWTAFTGGDVRFPPTIWKGSILVGSGDGWVYSLEARTGKLIWRFRAAPIERKIPVYGSLLSTWPVASGVLVDDGIAYVAAGIVNYDGTHVYALDAKTGEIKWQNNTSGHLLPEARTGVSVQGQMLINDGKLYLASGTSLSPAIFDINDGKCLNSPEALKKNESEDPRGWELYKIGDFVTACGKPFYSHPEHEVYDVSVSNKLLLTGSENKDIIWVNNRKIICYDKIDKKLLNENMSRQEYAGIRIPIWGRLQIPGEPLWEYPCDGSVAIAVGKNAVVLAEKSNLVVLNLQNGKMEWSQQLESSPVPWGLALSRDGKIFITLENGSIKCFGKQRSVLEPYITSNNTYFVNSARVTLACDIQGSEIRYTLDSSEPTQSSNLYSKPFRLNKTTVVKMRAFSKQYPPSFAVSQEFKKVDYAKAADPGKINVGIKYDYFEGYFTSVDNLDDVEPKSSGIMTSFKLEPRDEVNEFGYIYSGYLLVPEDGIYTFYIESNDGTKLYINGEEIINNDGGHPAKEESGKIALQTGEFPFLVKYFQMGGGKMLKVSWEGPGFKKKDITAETLFHKVLE